MELIYLIWLVDGDMSYPFDVNESILWLAELCDMVFVFFDPIGQVNMFVCLHLPALRGL